LLARWLVERAREYGVANALRYRYEPGAPAGDGLRLMLRRFFRVQRLSPEARRERVQAVLERFGVHDEEPEPDSEEIPRRPRRAERLDPRRTAVRELRHRAPRDPEHHPSGLGVADVLDALLNDAITPGRSRY